MRRSRSLTSRDRQAATYLEEIQVLWIAALPGALDFGGEKQAAECKHGQSVDVRAGPGKLNGCFRVAGDDDVGRFAAEDRFKVRDIRARLVGTGEDEVVEAFGDCRGNGGDFLGRGDAEDDQGFLSRHKFKECP